MAATSLDQPGGIDEYKVDAVLEFDMPSKDGSNVQDGNNAGSPSFRRAVGTHHALGDLLGHSLAEADMGQKLNKSGSKGSLEDEEWWFKRVVKGPRFDVICGVVITLNAITMGLQTNQLVAWRLAHVGEAVEVPSSTFVRNASYCFVTFYISELLLKCFVYGQGFFCGDQWKWNLFDILLVLVGMYDIMADALVPSSNTASNVSWMRMLRLLRMMKMLRVVRVMRIFRVLRMMLNSIAGSMMTLMWSILMLSLLMYVFGLCFVQIICGYLSDTPMEAMDPVTLESIRSYWGSVSQSIITLYLAVTGGADWEPLAQPVREAGEAYYLLFLFYIAFTAFAVLNVLTGLYVDTATKISERDDESVGEELYERVETKKFMAFFGDLAEKTGGPRDSGTPAEITLHDFDSNLEHEVVQAFLKVTELTAPECRRIFRMLDLERDGRIAVEEFIGGCLHSKSASQSLDMLALLSETRRSMSQQAEFSANVDERFKALTQAVQEWTGKKPMKGASSSSSRTTNDKH